MKHRRFALLLLALLAPACGGSGGGSTVQPVTVGGFVRDYFALAPLAAAQLDTQGLIPALTVTSAGDGSYLFAAVPSSSNLDIVATLAANYRTTRNERIAVATTSIAQDLFAVATADQSRQYTAVSVTRTASTAMVIVDLVDAGAPQVNVPASDITIVDGGGTPIAAANGPYFFDTTGDIVPNATLSMSAAFGGRARVAFLNVPAGTSSVKVFFGAPGQFKLLPVVTIADGVTLVKG